MLAAGLEGLDAEQLPICPESLLPGNRVWKSRGWANIMAKTRANSQNTLTDPGHTS